MLPESPPAEAFSLRTVAFQLSGESCDKRIIVTTMILIVITIQCPRCTDPTEFGTMTSGLPCNACSTGLLLPTASESASASASTSESCPSWSCSKCGKRCPAKQVEERERTLVNNPLYVFLLSPWHHHLHDLKLTKWPRRLKNNTSLWLYPDQDLTNPC